MTKNKVILFNKKQKKQKVLNVIKIEEVGTDGGEQILELTLKGSTPKQKYIFETSGCKILKAFAKHNQFKYQIEELIENALKPAKDQWHPNAILCKEPSFYIIKGDNEDR